MVMSDGNLYVQSVADAYCGNDESHRPTYHPVDIDFGHRTADAYEELPIRDEAARESFYHLSVEVLEQYDYLIDRGFYVEWVDDDPYPDSESMFMALQRNDGIKVYSGNLSHPFFTDEENKMFRFVHDVFGHARYGYQFGPRGEFNAMLSHARMFSKRARPALYTETHGQNSWVNFYQGFKATEYAIQKGALLPRDIINHIEEHYL